MKINMKNKIIFLFGAGISAPAGLPLSNNLTEIILSGKDIYRNTAGNYSFGKKPSIIHENFYETRVLEVVRILYQYLTEYYFHRNRTPNYEDFFQLSNSLSGYNNRPEFKPLMEYFYAKIKFLLHSRKEENPKKKIEAFNLFDEVCNYISCIVWHKLSINFEEINLDYLQSIVDACNDNKINEIYIFTLNHDLVLEKLFKDEGIDYIDGFSNETNRVRYWKPELFETDCRVKLYKLHGSINWFEFLSETDPSNPIKLGIPLDRNYWHTRDENGNLQLPNDGKPLFLTGNENKILDYFGPYFLSLISRFNEILHIVDKIIVSGYSFSDNEINRILRTWLNNGKKRKIINISESKPQNLWLQNESLITIDKYIQNTNYKDIKEKLEE